VQPSSFLAVVLRPQGRTFKRGSSFVSSNRQRSSPEAAAVVAMVSDRDRRKAFFATLFLEILLVNGTSEFDFISASICNALSTLTKSARTA